MVTNSAISIAAARIKQVATERFQRKEAQSTSGYKIMEIVGRFAGENHWDASFALTCYRAARNLDDDLRKLDIDDKENQRREEENSETLQQLRSINKNLDTLTKTVLLMERRLSLVEDQIKIMSQKNDS